MILIVLTYLCLVTFAATVLLRALKIARMPLHLRWELYPVPHDPNAAHGGSVFENPSWWRVRWTPNRMGAVKAMASEILLLKGVRENNRSLWWRSYPFHGGLYLLAVFVVLLAASALGEAGSSLHTATATLATIVGVAGFALVGAGALGLFGRRMADPALRAHSSPADFFHLLSFAVVAALGLLSFATVDPGFVHLREFARSSLRFQPVTLPALVALQIVVGLALLVYLPFSHMSHFFTKWFMYHGVRWDDRANRVGSKLETAIQSHLAAKVTWAAPHVGGGGGKSWVDVATAEVKK
jgi:nitrate reductase gamma subunit